MASGLWFAGGGSPPSTVIVKLFSDGSVNLNMGASDLGTGTKTVMAMVVAEELGVPVKKIQIEHADTGTTQYATPSGGSKTVPTESPAVRAAAVEVKQQLFDLAAKELKTNAADLTLKNGEILSRSDPSKKVKITGLSDLKRRGVLLGIGYRGPNPQGKVVNPFAAQFCEVEVNMKTGEVKVLRFLSANDSGRVMNRLTFDNQVVGGITMGIGLAMTEARILDGKQTGKMVNRNWHDYKLPTALDVPAEVQSLPIELEDLEANTTGAKGLGEPVTIPTAAASCQCSLSCHRDPGDDITHQSNETECVAFTTQEGGMTHAYAEFFLCPTQDSHRCDQASLLRWRQAPCRGDGPPRLSSRRCLSRQESSSASASSKTCGGYVRRKTADCASERSTTLTEVAHNKIILERYPALAKAASGGGEPSAPEPGDHRRKHLPEATVLVLPGRVSLSAKRRGSVLCLPG